MPSQTPSPLQNDFEDVVASPAYFAQTPSPARTPSPASNQDRTQLQDHHDLSPLATLDLEELLQMAKCDDHVHEMSFVACLCNASLDDGDGLTGATLEWLRNPPTHQLQIENPDV